MPAPRVLAAVQQQMTQDFIYKVLFFTEPRVKYNGVYYSQRGRGFAWLRFYDDGMILSTSTNDTRPENLLRWFHRGNTELTQGSLKLRSRHNMQFRLTSSAGLIDCHGQGKDEGLMVQWYSHISRKRGADCYSFVPCQVPEDDVWPEGVDPSLQDHFLLDYDMDPGAPHTPLSYMEMGEELDEAMEEEDVHTEGRFGDF